MKTTSCDVCGGTKWAINDGGLSYGVTIPVGSFSIDLCAPCKTKILDGGATRHLDSISYSAVLVAFKERAGLPFSATGDAELDEKILDAPDGSFVPLSQAETDKILRARKRKAVKAEPPKCSQGHMVDSSGPDPALKEVADPVFVNVEEVPTPSESDLYGVECKCGTSLSPDNWNPPGICNACFKKELESLPCTPITPAGGAFEADKVA